MKAAHLCSLAALFPGLLVTESASAQFTFDLPTQIGDPLTSAGTPHRIIVASRVGANRGSAAPTTPLVVLPMSAR
jgi:hypothetical protein